ncbi:hypothetical protein [Agromyces bauzanensis]|nr:hypothetical protein [Agromyces bauzanensis]
MMTSRQPAPPASRLPGELAPVHGASTAHAFETTYDAVLFDMDGVVTNTASMHAMAWEKLFDAVLSDPRAGVEDLDRVFDADEDYRRYVDGRSREDGVAAFLASRGITLEPGTPRDSPDAWTIAGLAARKNELFLAELNERGLRSVAVLDRWRIARVSRLDPRGAPGDEVEPAARHHIALSVRGGDRSVQRRMDRRDTRSAARSAHNVDASGAGLLQGTGEGCDGEARSQLTNKEFAPCRPGTTNASNCCHFLRRRSCGSLADGSHRAAASPHNIRASGKSERILK